MAQNDSEKSAAALRERRIFEEFPVPKAVAAMVIPTIISQVIFVIYNLADTWYVGLRNDANAVAAISLCLPVYTLLSGISNLFGIGGAGVIARALGMRDVKKARSAFSLSFWGAFCAAVIYALLMLSVERPLLLLIGGNAENIDYAVSYVRWTVVIGGIPTILLPVLGHLIRAAGFPRQASFGMALGAVLNIILDPLFMFILLPPGNEVLGAAVATALSNAIALAYFCIYIFLSRRTQVYGIKPELHRKELLQMLEILRGGLPGFCMVALAMLSNCILNSLLSVMGSAAIAGIGIVRKIDQLAYAVNQGVTQGMLPLVAYCYASKRYQRMWAAAVFSAACTEIFSLLCTGVSFAFAPNLVAVFIKDIDTIQYGAYFLRILCLAIPVYTLTFVIIAIFQAVGRGIEPFVLSVLHKGTLDIILMFFIARITEIDKITWAAPVSETAALIAAIGLLVHFLRKMKKLEVKKYA